jgi:anti-sigma factor ChrR (cupin superfamily)
VQVFHRTSSANAAAIAEGGFRDGEGTYGTGEMFRGVWLADTPLDDNEGAHGETVLAVEIPEAVLTEWEWVEEGKRYREFLVPANLVNEFPRAVVDVENDWQW